MIAMPRLILGLSLLSLMSCASNAPKNSSLGAKVSGEHLVAATLWVRTSAEYRALAYQAFNIAKVQIDEQLKKKKKSARPMALVVDADETVVDNSDFQVSSIEEMKPYSSETWKAWTDQARAKAIPGAKDFLNYANNKGVEVFYVTNRKENEYTSTLKNLRELGFPVKEENLLVRKTTSSKKERRELITQKYDIVLLMGDNMGDFSELYEKKSVKDRAAVADQMREEFGHKMIVLPNPMYGDWEASLYDNDMKKTEEEKAQLRKAGLQVRP